MTIPFIPTETRPVWVFQNPGLGGTMAEGLAGLRQDQQAQQLMAVKEAEARASLTQQQRLLESVRNQYALDMARMQAQAAEKDALKRMAHLLGPLMGPVASGQMPVEDAFFALPTDIAGTKTAADMLTDAAPKSATEVGWETKQDESGAFFQINPRTGETRDVGRRGRLPREPQPPRDPGEVAAANEAARLQAKALEEALSRADQTMGSLRGLAQAEGFLNKAARGPAGRVTRFVGPLLQTLGVPVAANARENEEKLSAVLADQLAALLGSGTFGTGNSITENDVRMAQNMVGMNADQMRETTRLILNKIRLAQEFQLNTALQRLSGMQQDFPNLPRSFYETKADEIRRFMLSMGLEDRSRTIGEQLPKLYPGIVPTGRATP